ncbi:MULTISPECIES: hypothetical protein [Cupriavidus]
MPLLKTLLIAATRQAVHTLLLLIWLQLDPDTVAQLSQICSPSPSVTVSGQSSGANSSYALDWGRADADRALPVASTPVWLAAVKARHTYAYRRDGSQWSTASHHSSAMPEKT